MIKNVYFLYKSIVGVV